MNRPKVTIVGAGQVGATVGHLLMLKGLADLMLIDVVEGLAQGKALDLLQAAAIEDRAVEVTGTTDLAAIAGSRLVVVTAGLARKPGMSRDDLLAANANIVGPIADQIGRHAPEAVVIVVTNPLDVMTYLVLQRTGFPRHRVIGMAGALDTGRLRAFVAQRLKTEPATVQALVLGSHGDLMVSLSSSITVNGAPVTQLVSAQELDQLITRTRDGGAEIVNLLKTGSAFYAPSAAIVEMVEAILKDKKKILPCAAYLEGEYGIQGLFAGVPVKLGARGIEKIIEIKLNAEEQAALEKSAAAVKELVDIIGV